MSAFALFVVASVLVAAHAGEVPSSEACDTSAMAIGVDDFALRALGGHPSCVDADNKDDCCDQVRGLFGEGGPAGFCMCNADFFSAIMMALPAHSAVDPTSYVDMLEKCGVPVAGKTTCPGVEVETPVEPVVQAQVLIKKKIVKGLLLKKGLGLAALAQRRRSSGGGGGGGVEGASAVVEPEPPVDPLPPPVDPLPMAAGKGNPTYIIYSGHGKHGRK